MRTATIEKTTEWFGILKMSGLLISEVVYRSYFSKKPSLTWREKFELRRNLDRFNVGSYSVNNLIKVLLFDILNHNPDKWLYGKDARKYSKTEPDHSEELTPDFVLPVSGKDIPAFVIKTVNRDVELDKRKAQHSGVWRASEHIKFEALLRLMKCPLGLLTNGNEFRLVYVEEGLSTAYISWKQNDWIENELTFEAFRNHLNVETLLPSREEGIYKLIKDSHEKQAEVTDALADQVYNVINKLLDYVNQSDINEPPEKVYDAVIKVVMRLVFILYAEENSLLPHGFPEYDENYGLIHLANELEAERASLGKEDFAVAAAYRYDAWYRILSLFNLIYYGSDHPDLKITAHGGDLFSPEGVMDLLKKIKLNNNGVREILHDLLYMKGLRLSYAAIDVEQIGYVYEGLLGYTVTRAPEDMVVTAKEKYVLPLSELEKRSAKEIKKLLSVVDKKITKIPDSFPEPESNSLEARVERYAAILASPEERLIKKGSYYLSTSGARKSTGSYYTPKQLTNYLVRETLKPLCYKQIGRKKQLKSSYEILKLKVVDPAMGSGAFLVQATNFLSEKLLKAWEIEGKHMDISDTDREILAKREIVEHCIYGVDINPVAVELAKMSLWLVTFSKDKPFTFLDHKLKCGNSLIGVFHGWEDINVIPPEVYKTSNNVSKEWKKKLSELKKINQKYNPTKKHSDARHQGSLFPLAESIDPKFLEAEKELSQVAQSIDVAGKETEDYFAKEYVYREKFLSNKKYLLEKLKADLWVAQWFANEVDGILPLTTGQLQESYRLLEQIVEKDNLPVVQVNYFEWVKKISEEERFFHWKLEFPNVFESGGFDAVIGNPPWEVLKLKEREYFAGKNLEVYSNKKTNERRALIAKLKETNPSLYRAYMRKLEHYNSIGTYVSYRKLYELTSKGELNTYQLFAELFLKLRKESGRAGVIVPTGIATDKGNSKFFRYIVENKLLASLADFINGKIFKNIDSRMRFSLIVFGKSDQARMLFVLRNPEQLYTKQFLKISTSDLLLINPNTGTAPVFSSQRDMDLVLKIYRNNTVLLREYPDGRTDNPYGIKIFRQFDMSNDSDKFVKEQELIDHGYKKNWIYYEKDGEKYVPLCEGKSFYILDSRYNHISEDGNGIACTAEEKSDPWFFPKTRYFLNESYLSKIPSFQDYHKKWFLTFRKITNSTNERTIVATISYFTGYGDAAPTILTNFSTQLLTLLVSHTFDFVTRMKFQGTNMNFFILYQLPVPDPAKFKELPGIDDSDSCLEDSVIRRLVKCVNYSYDMEPFVKDMGYEIEPRPWNERERLDYMAQLDAIAAHLYGISYEDLEYIFTTFPIEKRTQEETYGTYLSRDLALEYFKRYEPIFKGAMRDAHED